MLQSRSELNGPVEFTTLSTGLRGQQTPQFTPTFQLYKTPVLPLTTQPKARKVSSHLEFSLQDLQGPGADTSINKRP